jgi:hypothetical protein
MFGRKNTDDNELRGNHREYFRNCIIQIEELEARLGPSKWASLRVNFADVWTDDSVADEIDQKVALARKFATDLEPSLAATSIDAAGKALELVQEIIDNAERQVQDLLAALVLRQSFKASRP